jgi:SAM-dependent methyltransferase
MADAMGDATMILDPTWREKNRAMWDAKTPLHVDSPLYDIAGFKAGGLSLRALEVEDLGDVRGKDLIHLQCHFGKDTLSWARLGANVVGLDFSVPAIRAANDLAREIGLDAHFVVSDVYDARVAVSGRRFDIVYTGVGALCWLPDMMRWAKVVFDLLMPGGELYLFEFHPIRWIFDPGQTREPVKRDDYFSPTEGFPDGGVTYADASIPAAATPTVQWNHPLGEVVTALVRAGLVIDSLTELDRSVLRDWEIMEPAEDRMYRMPRDRPSLPLMYVLRAHREG